MSIKDLIRERGLKQNWLAERIGLSQGRFNAIVNVKRNLPSDRVSLLAALLGVEPELILTIIATQKGDADADRVRSGVAGEAPGEDVHHQRPVDPGAAGYHPVQHPGAAETPEPDEW
jgi:transcriptional regulator with XRE-family HTH domain